MTKLPKPRMHSNVIFNAFFILSYKVVKDLDPAYMLIKAVMM